MGNPKDAKPYPIRMAEWTKDDLKAIADAEKLTMGEMIERLCKLYSIVKAEIEFENYYEMFDGRVDESERPITVKKAWVMLFGAKERESKRAKELRDFLSK